MYENELSKIQRLLEEKKLKEQAVLQAREDIVRTIDQNFGIKKMIMDSALEIGTGLNGKDGIDGKDGINGRDGKDGINGKDGKNGRDGLTGKPGKDGANGKDGEDGQPGLNGNDGVGIESVNKVDNNLIVTLTNGATQNVGSFPKSNNGGKYSRSPFEYAQEAGYTGTEDAFYTLLANIGSSGGSTTGSGIIDFGAAPGTNTALVTVSDTNVKTDSTIQLMLGNSTTDHNVIEHQLSGITLYADNIINATSFRINGLTQLRLTGTFAFKYVIL